MFRTSEVEVIGGVRSFVSDYLYSSAIHYHYLDVPNLTYLRYYHYLEVPRYSPLATRCRY